MNIRSYFGIWHLLLIHRNLYFQKQHLVIVQNNHIAEQGSPLLMMDLSIKNCGDSRQYKYKGRYRKQIGAFVQDDRQGETDG